MKIFINIPVLRSWHVSCHVFLSLSVDEMSQRTPCCLVDLKAVKVGQWKCKKKTNHLWVRRAKITAHNDKRVMSVFCFFRFHCQNLWLSIKASAQINELFILRLFPSFSFWLTINKYSFIHFLSHPFVLPTLLSFPSSLKAIHRENFSFTHIHNTSRMCYKKKIVIYCISFRN